MRICIIGDPNDLTAVYVGWLARNRGIEVIELNEDELGITWSFAFDDTKGYFGTIEAGSFTCSFLDLNGAFVRLNSQPKLPRGLDLSPLQHHTFVVERRFAIHHFLHSLPCTVANRPSSGRSNGSKPYQMRLLTRAGFQVPKWLMSNELPQIRNFARECPSGVIYKSCSGLRSRVRFLDDEVLERMMQGTTPVVVQEYIKGHDVRVHTVGDHIFSTKIISPRVDYRFDSNEIEFQATSIPVTIGKLCREFAVDERLIIAGFDFRVTESGHWYCLEVNPVPTFLSYEIPTGQPIGDALLDLFIHAKSS